MNKTKGWRLFGAALLAGLAFLTGPDPGSAQICCSCDYSYSYYLCYSGCGSDQACQSACFNEWMAAEGECARNCPGPIC